MCGGLLSVVMVLLDIICSLKKEIFFQPVLISLSFLLYFLSFLFLIGCVRKKQLQYIENLFLLMVCLSVMENVNWWKWSLNLVLCGHCRAPLISAGKRVYHLLQSFGTTFFFFGQFYSMLFRTERWSRIPNGYEIMYQMFLMLFCPLISMLHVLVAVYFQDMGSIACPQFCWWTKHQDCGIRVQKICIH